MYVCAWTDCDFRNGQDSFETVTFKTHRIPLADFIQASLYGPNTFHLPYTIALTTLLPEDTA